MLNSSKALLSLEGSLDTLFYHSFLMENPKSPTGSRWQPDPELYSGYELGRK